MTHPCMSSAAARISTRNCRSDHRSFRTAMKDQTTMQLGMIGLRESSTEAAMSQTSPSGRQSHYSSRNRRRNKGACRATLGGAALRDLLDNSWMACAAPVCLQIDMPQKGQGKI